MQVKAQNRLSAQNDKMASQKNKTGTASSNLNQLKVASQNRTLKASSNWQIKKQTRDCQLSGKSKMEQRQLVQSCNSTKIGHPAQICQSRSKIAMTNVKLAKPVECRKKRKLNATEYFTYIIGKPSKDVSGCLVYSVLS